MTSSNETVDERPGWGRAPILVTGVPRSGTTWLARALADAPGTALAGREPMNPRGSQYALGGTLSGWSRLTRLTPRQTRSLKLAYLGLNPFVYSRFGQRQWAAPWPRTRIIVKDPFAMLSLPAIVGATNAFPVLVFRHPAAVLASYRRMGWSADTDEVDAALGLAAPTPTDDRDDARAMAHFWRVLNEQALRDLASLDASLVVSHEEVAIGGPAAMARLFELTGLPRATPPGRATRSEDGRRALSADPTALHNFDRPPEDVANAWRADICDADLAVMESIAGETLETLETRRAHLR